MTGTRYACRTRCRSTSSANAAGCTAANVTAGTSSKCSANDAATVTGLVVQGWLRIAKETDPDDTGDTFGFVAAADGGYTPSPSTFTLQDGQSQQITSQLVYVPLDPTGGTRVLTVQEDPKERWGPGASISCTTSTGGAASFVTIDNANRKLTANLTGTNGAAICTVTNTRQTRVRTVKALDPTNEPGAST